MLAVIIVFFIIIIIFLKNLARKATRSAAPCLSFPTHSPRVPGSHTPLLSPTAAMVLGAFGVGHERSQEHHR